MSFLSDFDRYGSPWFVQHDLNSAGVATIVTPKPLFRGPAGIAGDRFCEEWQIVVLGFAYHVAAAGAGAGFYIRSQGQDGIIRIHYRCATQAAGSFGGSVTPCYMPIQRADFSNSPSMDPSVLQIETIGTCILGSSVSIWGIHTTTDWGRMGYTGSPVDYTSPNA